MLRFFDSMREAGRGSTTAVADMARYAAMRFTYLRSRTPLVSILDRIVADAVDGLLEARKETAGCIAGVHRARESVESEEAMAAEWNRRAERARTQGDEILAHEARGWASMHERMAADTRAQAERLRQDVEQLKLELRLLNDTIEHAKAVVSKLHTDRKLRSARVGASRGLAKIREIRSTLETIVGASDGPRRPVE
jgi:phage shock protein A